MIDIHCHILSGLDDGARDEDETEKMLELARSQGITKIIATPHWFAEKPFDRQSVVERIRRCPEGPELLPGAEIFFSGDVVELARQGKLPTLGETNYILLEFPMREIYSNTDEMLFAIQLAGYRPVIAHPERNLRLADDLERLSLWVDRRILLQINSGSLLGLFGEKTEKAAKKILAAGLASFIATDAHSAGGRRPNLGLCKEKLAGLIDAEAASKLLQKNPGLLLQGREVEPVTVEIKRSGLLEKLLEIFKK